MGGGWDNDGIMMMIVFNVVAVVVVCSVVSGRWQFSTK